MVAAISLVIVVDARCLRQLCRGSLRHEYQPPAFSVLAGFSGFRVCPGPPRLGAKLPLAARLGEIPFFVVVWACWAEPVPRSPPESLRDPCPSPRGTARPACSRGDALRVNVFPRWLFTAWFYPVTRAARGQRAGQCAGGPLDGRVAQGSHRPCPVSVHRFAQRANRVSLDGKYFPPERLADVQVSPGLEFVYLAGCEGGAQRQE